MEKAIEYFNDYKGRKRKALSDTNWNKKYLKIITILDRTWDNLTDLQAMPQLYRKNTAKMKKWKDDITFASNKINDSAELLDKWRRYVLH